MQHGNQIRDTSSTLRSSDRLDPLSVEERSRQMGRIRSKDTKPEIAVRKIVHGMGFRYRLHTTDIVGKPDIVFRGRKKVIFVHGCFWHQHVGCKFARIPKSRVEFWEAKLHRNEERDKEVEAQLRKDGWGVLTIWECEVRDSSLLERRVQKFIAESDCREGG